MIIKPRTTLALALLFGILSVGSMISILGLSTAPLPPLTITTEAYAHDFSFDKDLVVGDVLDMIRINDKEEVQGVPPDEEPAGEEDDETVFCFAAVAFSVAVQLFCFEDNDDCQFGQSIAERNRLVIGACTDLPTLPTVNPCAIADRSVGGSVYCPPPS